MDTIYIKMIKNIQKRTINKDEFCHLVAKEAEFTLGDVKKIWAVVENIFSEVIEKDYILNLHGFGKLYVADVASKNKTWDNINKKEISLPATKRIVFKLSNNFKRIINKK
jgi:nucleoid DNA-binding protein